MEHCSPFGVSLYAWQLRGLADEEADEEAPGGEGKCPTGLDICVPEAMEWVFIMGWLSAHLAL